MDKVFIHGLNVSCIVGIFEHERISPQQVCIDIDMLWDNKRAASTEDITFALDYKTVSEAVEHLVVERQFLLVETMAEEIANLLKNDFSVAGSRIRVSKPEAINQIDAVGVEIIRGKF